MKDLVHTGDSSNIAYYAEPDGREPHVWAEVLRSDSYWTGTSRQRNRQRHDREIPRFYISVRRTSTTGEIARTMFQPRKPVPAGPLDAAVVTRLVRQALVAAPYRRRKLVQP